MMMKKDEGGRFELDWRSLLCRYFLRRENASSSYLAGAQLWK